MNCFCISVYEHSSHIQTTWIVINLSAIWLSFFQEKSSENEKAEEMAADESSDKPSSYAVGARVACLSTWDNLLRMFLPCDLPLF